MQRHYTAIGQLMQAMSSPMVPEEVKDYMVKTVRSLDRFMKRVLKDFGYDQPEQYVPEPKLPQLPPAGEGGPDQKGAGRGQVAPGGAPLQSAIAAAAQRGPGMVPAPVNSGIPGGSPGAPGAGGGQPPV